MDFDFSPEERAFEKEVEAFLAENASPDVMDAHPEQLSQTVDTPAKRAFMRKLAERGWLGMSWPKEYGGQEKLGHLRLPPDRGALARGAPQPGKGVGIVGKTIIRHGNEKLKQRLPAADHPRRDRVRDRLQRAAGGLRRREHAARAPRGAGRLEARRPEDLDHRRPTSPTGTGSARAPTRPHKHKGITLFLIPMDHPGLTIRPTWTIGDERTNEVFFDDVFVGRRLRRRRAEPRLDLHLRGARPGALRDDAGGPAGEEGRGAGRLGAQRASATARRSARTRSCARASPQLATQLEVARMLQRRVISEALKGRVPTVAVVPVQALHERAAASGWRTRRWTCGPERAAQARPGGAPLGGRFERSYRYTVVDTIGGGTSEIQKNIIARRGLGLPPCF